MLSHGIQSAVEITEKARNVSHIGKAINFVKDFFNISSSTTTASTGTLSLNLIGGTTLLLSGCLIGVALGGYLTHKFCEELLDKYVEYYKKNCRKIQNSYIEAAEYFHQ